MTPLILAAVFLCAQPRTIDGDTFACRDGTRVRSWGIQAPERSDPGGPASTAAMANMLAGQTLTCTIKGPDSYQRKVALCTLPDGRDVAAEMIRSGHAVEWCSFSKNHYGDCK